MALRFDATLKALGSAYPDDLLAAFDPGAAGPAKLLNVDLSTVTAATDVVLGVGDPLAEVVAFDFQASADADKHLDVLAYSALLYRTYRVPVHSIVVLLRREARHPNLTGQVRYSARPGRGRMKFDYEVVALYERPAEELLEGPLGVSPLAVLGRLPTGVPLVEGLTATAQRAVDRIKAEAAPEQAKNLVAAAFVLTGLRVPRDVARIVYRGVREMRESDTFMAILEEGQADHARRAICRLAGKKLGPAGESDLARLQAISDIDKLDRILDRAYEAASWQDLLATP